MHAVVNHLHFTEPVDPALFGQAERDLAPAMRAIAGFRGFHVIQAAVDHAILVIICDTAEAVDRLATEVGSPWMRANVLPLLARPPDRHVGPVVATTGLG